MSVEYIDSATGLQVLVKQPSEVRKFAMDFANKLRNAIISSITSVAVTSLARVTGSAAVTVSGMANTDSEISFLLSGGTSGEMYQITAKAVLSNGESLEGDGALLVAEA